MVAFEEYMSVRSRSSVVHTCSWESCITQWPIFDRRLQLASGCSKQHLNLAFFKGVVSMHGSMVAYGSASQVAIRT
jgi:hypothetical protein